MKNILAVTALISIVFISSCDMRSEIKFSDKNKNSEKVYGQEGKPAKQLANTYPADTASSKRVQNIRKKLYPTK
jgi:hypothetical protein